MRYYSFRINVVIALCLFWWQCEQCESGWMDGSVSQKWARRVYAAALKCLTMKLENGFYLDAIESLTVWRNNGGCVWEKSECQANSTIVTIWQWVFFRHTLPSPFILLRAPRTRVTAARSFGIYLCFSIFDTVAPWKHWAAPEPADFSEFIHQH